MTIFAFFRGLFNIFRTIFLCGNLLRSKRKALLPTDNFYDNIRFFRGLFNVLRTIFYVAISYVVKESHVLPGNNLGVCNHRLFINSSQ